MRGKELRVTVFVLLVGCSSAVPYEEEDAGADSAFEEDSDLSSDGTIRFVLEHHPPPGETEGDSLWICPWDPIEAEGRNHWLTILHDGGQVRYGQSCYVCMCDSCPDCPICGPPLDNSTELPAPGSVELEWDGNTYPQRECPDQSSARCQDEVPAPPGDYTARFCWSPMSEPRCPLSEGEVQCAEVEFRIPNREGIVRFAIADPG